MEEACTVWEGVLIDQKEESTSTDMPLGTAIHNIEITLGKGGQLARAAGAVYKIGTAKGNTILINLEIFDDYMEQFREPPTEMKHPLPNVKGD